MIADTPLEAVADSIERMCGRITINVRKRAALFFWIGHAIFLRPTHVDLIRKGADSACKMPYDLRTLTPLPGCRIVRWRTLRAIDPRRRVCSCRPLWGLPPVSSVRSSEDESFR